MRPLRSVRAWIYVLSVAALLVPAGGIAYLGAVSYRDEKGAVSAQDDRQRQAELAIAARVDHAIEAAIADAERAAAPIAHGDSNEARALPGLARASNPSGRRAILCCITSAGSPGPRLDPHHEFEI